MVKEKKSFNPIDVHVGKRIRLRRNILGFSQEFLAKAVGISFQQIQKYERGSNRVSASRLFAISTKLNTEVSFFFEGLEPEDYEKFKNVTGLEETKANFDIDPMERNETLELVRNYWNIVDNEVRENVSDLIASISKGIKH